MTTEEIMSLALGMSGYLRIPEDSSIFVPGKGIRKVLFGLDVGTAELQLAKTMGADLVIAHHPPATAVEVWKIFLRHVEFMTAAGVPEAAALAAVAEKVEALLALPEMRAAPTTVQLAMGNARDPVRKVVVAHGAYTNGGYPVAHTCFTHGVDLVVYIHIDFGELQRLRAEGRGNLIVTGHLAGDSLGFTPFLRELRGRGLEVTTFSGVIEPTA